MVPRRTRIDSNGFHLGTIAVILLVVLLIWIQNPGVPHDSSISNNDKQAAKRYVHSSNDKPKVSSNLKEGVVGGVAYYHCSRITAESIHQKSTPRQQPQSLVLLHGAKFTKKYWKSSEILSMFCKNSQASFELSVVALDLTVEASHKDLALVLDALETAEVVTKPVTLVTPSASGKCMVDWLRHQEEASSSRHRLGLYVHRWIPVASGAVQQLDEAQMKRYTGSLSILAIYGDRDKRGKILSERLQEIAAPKTRALEIKGGHPCYLESPSTFVKAVLDFMATA